MRVTMTGATGLIGPTIVSELLDRGDEVTVLSRDAARARRTLGSEVLAFDWDLHTQPAPAEALAGRDGVIHLAGENVGQRWTDEARREIHASRELGTRNLIAGIAAADPRPRVLVSSSAVGVYGSRGDELLTEASAPGGGFLADVVKMWEREAEAAREHGLRVVTLRTGVILDAAGGALSKMLPFFRAGIGGPVAGGRQYMPWVHPDDMAGMAIRALEDERWSGPVNVTSPEPATNSEVSKELGRVLRRPAFAPVPGLAVKVLYGEMSEMVTKSQRVIPARAQELGYEWRRPALGQALRAALSD